MKKTGLVVVFMLAIQFVNAQTFDEWFRQKETQIRYLTEQIAALRAYGEVVNKGYSIARGGLTNISSSKDKDFHQHDGYIESLWTVNSAIRGYPKLTAIYHMSSSLTKLVERVQSLHSEYLSKEETKYIKSVFSSLLKGTHELLVELETVLSDDQLSLKDDERIKRVDAIHLQVTDRYAFAQGFAANVKRLVLSRTRDQLSTDRLQDLKGLK